MQLFVRGQALHAISVSSGTTTSDVKDIISVFEGIPTEEQLLTYAGIPLEDDAVVLNVVPEHGTISVTARIIGGMYIRRPTLCILFYLMPSVNFLNR